MSAKIDRQGLGSRLQEGQRRSSQMTGSDRAENLHAARVCRDAVRVLGDAHVDQAMAAKGARNAGTAQTQTPRVGLNVDGGRARR